MKLSTVTVTGADDSVHPRDLAEITREYPFVEFGILLSRGAMGRPRFPSADWLRLAFGECSGKGVRFAGHICGSWVSDSLLGEFPIHELNEIHNGFVTSGLFRRWQLNTHAKPHPFNCASLGTLLRLLSANRQSVIFQYDGVNTSLVPCIESTGCKNASFLFDLSHGAGILPTEWPVPLDGIPCGYAGGLSPENVADQLRRLEKTVGDGAFWIDAETHLRSRHDKEFDLNKVRAFLEAVTPWVTV